MMTVNDVSKLTGVSVRTLQYYDNIGLLKPDRYSESGYRLYGDRALAKLQEILLFRTLEFPLKEIKQIMESPSYERETALAQQIELLEMRKEHIENLIAFAKGLTLNGGKNMDFSAFDTRKMDEYAQKAKESWGNTAEYQAFVQKEKGRTADESRAAGEVLMRICAGFGALQDRATDDPLVIAQVERLKAHITENYYHCSNTILAQLGQMYAAGGDFSANINAVGGDGAAEFANAAIQKYCGAKE